MSKSKNQESIDADYLEKNNVKNLINDALLQVAIFQPEEPFSFLANHFEWERLKSNSLKYASTLCNQQYSSTTMEYAIHQAYLMISQYKDQEDLKNITGTIYMDFIQLLCSDLQHEHGDEELRLLESIYIPPKNVVSFRQFRAAVYCCLLYRKYLQMIKSLYANISKEKEKYLLSGNTSISKLLAVQILNQIYKRKRDEIGDEVQLIKISAPRNNQENHSTTLEEFIFIASDLFWKNVSIEDTIQQ